MWTTVLINGGRSLINVKGGKTILTFLVMSDNACTWEVQSIELCEKSTESLVDYFGNTKTKSEF